MYRQIMDELVSDARDSHRNRVGPKYWDGSAGAIGTVNNNAGVLAVVPSASAVSSGSNITANQRETISGYAGNAKSYMSSYAGCRYLRVGMQVQIGLATELQNNTGTSGVITAVDQSAQTFQLDVDLPAGSANRFIVEGDANGNEFGNVITGLYDAINDSGTYHGIDRSEAEVWKSFIVRNNNTLRDFNHFRITSLLMRMGELGPKSVDEMDPVIFSHSSLLRC